MRVQAKALTSMTRFQWIAVQMNQVLRLKTKPEIEAQLEHFPRDLTGAYQTIFNKIDKLDGFQPAIAKRAFQWLLASPTGEIETEVLHAAVWQHYDSDEDDVHNDDGRQSELQIPPAGTGSDYILDACQHLIVEESGYFKWSHISVREYLLDYKQVWAEAAAITAGSVCLLALMDDSFYEIEHDGFYDSEDEDPSLAKLKKYAGLNYGTYLKALDMAEADSPPRKLLSRFFESSSSQHPSPFSRLGAYGPIRARLDFDGSSKSYHKPYHLPSEFEQPQREHPIWPVCHYGLESSFDELPHASLDDAILHTFSFGVEDYMEVSLLEAAMCGQSVKIIEALLELGLIPTEGAVGKALLLDQISYLKLLDKYSGRRDCVSLALQYMDERLNAKELKLFKQLLAYAEESRGKEWSEWHLLRQNILQRDENAVRALLRKGANPNYSGPGNLTFDSVLGLALELRSKSMVQILLDNKADPNGNEHSRPLLRACKAAMHELKDLEGESDLGFVKLLLDYGADPNKMQVARNEIIVGALHQETIFGALHLVLMRGKPHPLVLLKLLLERGADPNGVVRKDFDGTVETVLSYAIRHGVETEHLQILVDKGALVDGDGESSNPPLKAAFYCDRLPFLCDNGVDMGQIRREWVDEAIERALRERDPYTATCISHRLRFVQEIGGPVTVADISKIYNTSRRWVDEIMEEVLSARYSSEDTTSLWYLLHLVQESGGPVTDADLAKISDTIDGQPPGPYGIAMTGYAYPQTSDTPKRPRPTFYQFPGDVSVL